MEIRESQLQTQSKLKLPLTADWWRDVDKNKRRSNYSQIEYLESPSPDSLPPQKEENSIQRDSTIDSTGAIEISNILFPVYSETERQIYEKNCQRLQCPTSQKFGKILDHMSMGIQPEDVKMAHYGLTSMGVRATALSISNLSQCSTIDIQGNKLTMHSLSTLISVVKKSSVTEINLSSTDISKFGPRILSSWISSPMRVKKLYLRDNQFDDTDGKVLFDSLAANRSITFLDVAQNHFCIHCANSLKKLFDENDVLEVIDLSWNHLRQNAIISIAKGLKKNNGLKILNLSWNGVEDLGAKELGLTLKENDCLQELELVCNRITDSGFQMLMKCLDKNGSLKCIKIGRNILSQITAEEILQSLKNGELRDSAIETLDFTNNSFKKNFQTVIDSVKETRSKFNCPFGYKDNYEEMIISYKPVMKTIKFLRLYIEENNINLFKIFEKFDINKKMIVNPNEFRQGLKEACIPVSDEQIERLIEYFDPNGTGKVNFSKLVLDSEEPIQKN